MDSFDNFATFDTTVSAPGIPADEENSRGNSSACVVARSDGGASAPHDEESNRGNTSACVIA